MERITDTAGLVDWAALDASVRRWLARRTPEGLVEDLAQETLLRVHRTLPADVRSPEAWALRTAHSTLVDHFRSVARRSDVATDPIVLAALAPLPAADDADRPDAGLDAEADRALDLAIAKCLGKRIDALPAEQRDALIVTGPGDRSQAQAAAEAGISVPGMKSRVQRGRDAVRSGAESCCSFELDARGRPIGMHPKDGSRCTCGCAD
ncbi:MAG: sigma factor [Solirubrobacteraceae bacterium]|nr:sigma factor [Solirubrobacteraceae bacterium]